MGTIQKRNNKYTATVRLKGYPSQSETFNDKKEAEAWITKTEDKIKNNQHQFKRNITLKDLIILYKGDKQRLYWWEKYLGDMNIYDITPNTLLQYRIKLQKDRKISNATVNRYIAAISSVLNMAVKDFGFLYKNPAHKVKRYRETKGRLRYLTSEELKKILTRCKNSSNPYLYIIVVIAIATGARKSEILNLTWQDIDLDRRLFYFIKTKNGEARSIPISDPIYEILLKLKKKSKSTHYLFPSPSGNRPVYIREAWEKVVEDIPDFRFHDLRHTAASYLAMNGATLLELSHILGHKTLAMVKRYSHLSENHTAKIIGKMNNTLFK